MLPENSMKGRFTMRRGLFGVLTTLLLIATLVIGAAPVAAKSQLSVLLDGLNSPKGLAVGPGRTLFMGQGAYGPPGPVLAYHLGGRAHRTTDVTFEAASVADLAALPDGSGWAIGTDLVLYHVAADGTITPVLNVPEYQVTDLDPYHDPGADTESNPFGLAVLPNGDALVADAAGNDILRVTTAGSVTTVARFAPEEITPGVVADPVPTSIAVGGDGWLYVGQLVGVPGTPGTAHIWRLNPNADGAVCDVTVPDPNCAVWKSGFTGIMDLAIDQASGKTYVYEIAAGGFLAFEEGFVTGVFPPAVLLLVQGNKRTELAAGQLSQPGSVVVTPDGVYVTDGMFTGGRLVRIRGNN
jgi:hypothetical protein